MGSTVDCYYIVRCTVHYNTIDCTVHGYNILGCTVHGYNIFGL